MVLKGDTIKMIQSVALTRKQRLIRSTLTSVVVFALTVIFLVIFLVRLDIAPFGDYSLASMDAKIQYLDFFTFYKNLLQGKESLTYTFSSGLGMSPIGIFAYYLASPFNLLILFFSKNEINTFFSVVVVLKIATAGITMSIFLNKRFEYRIPFVFTVFLSLGYALMQYNFAQNSNVMWLDGVYMLPLILLGVYYVAHMEKPLFLSVAVALSILFGWYSAGINCLYAIVWCLMEVLFSKEENHIAVKQVFRRIFMFIWSMALGVLASMVLFWPNVDAMRAGKGEFDWNNLNFRFKGNILQSVLRYSIGSFSDSTAAALFCGCFALIGAIGFFLSKNRKLRSKKIAGGMAVFSILIYYWQPLFFLYSLLKDATSYFFRYSYLSIFFLIFLAGFYYSEWDREKDVDKLVIGAIVFSISLLVLEFASKSDNLNYIYYTAVTAIIEAAILACLKKKNIVQVKKLGMIMLLCVISVMELCANGIIITRRVIVKDVSSYKKYRLATQKQVNSIKNMDSSVYRMSQTSTWNQNEYGLNITTNYNESMGYGYNGVASYTSSPQMDQLDFLTKLGYRKEGNCISVVNTSILPVDSFLGVKYVMSEMKIKGFEALDSIPKANGKVAYKNPYVLPVVFTWSGNSSKAVNYYGNPFEYVNALYSKLMGRKVKVFHPVSYQKVDENMGVHYMLSGIEKSEPIYGNIPSTSYANARINVNGIYFQDYSCWLSPSVFYIPCDETNAELMLTSENLNMFKAPQFYACDLDAMKKISSEINSRAASITQVRDGNLVISAKATDQNNKLFTSIPINSGWTVKVNGKSVKTVAFAGELMSIPLDEGKNIIELHYSIPGLKTGICGTIVGITLMILTQVIIKKRRKKVK